MKKLRPLCMTLLMILSLLHLAGCGGQGGAVRSDSTLDTARQVMNKAVSQSLPKGNEPAASPAAGLSSRAAGFASTIPAGGQTPPGTIYKTDSYQGPMQTNDWWSSVAWAQYSEVMYPHPFSVKFSASGLEVDYPRKVVYPQTFGEADIATDHNAALIVGARDFNPPDARVRKASDWGVDVEMAEGARKITTTVLHGSPYIYFTYDNLTPRITLKSTGEIFRDDGNSLGVKINGRYYCFFAPTGSAWSGAGTGTLECTLPAGRNYLTVAVLPAPEAYDFFKERAYAFVEDTKVSWNYDRTTSKVTSTFTCTTTAKEGSNRETIMALYPHQWRFNTSLSPTSWTYSSIRGTMKVISGTSFQVTTTYQGILPWFPDTGGGDRTTLYGLVDTALKEGAGNPPKYSSDTYWGGKYMGKVANLLPVAEQVGHSAAASDFKATMKRALENWLSYSEGKTGNYFYHDSIWGTYIGYPASYGSDTELNDHHFHYGYWVYAAAQLALRDKNWAAQWAPQVEKLVSDYANPDRSGTLTPFLRNFDPYAGHSWASGHAKFFHGNNQESSSEAVNSYAAMILWGEATGRTDLRDLGIYLYSTEVQAIQNYWFNIYGDNFDSEYPSIEATMIWGGKIVHTTWWTDDPIQVHGINCLPLCAHSLYLGYDRQYPLKNYNAMMSEYALRGSSPQLWKDIMAMFLAFSNPDMALNAWNPSLPSEDGESAAHTYHFIHSLKALGNVDASITADTPLYAVFDNKGQRTYAVYNAGESAITVNFSDSHHMTVAPNSMGLDTNADLPPGAPTLLQAEAGNGQVHVTWSAVPNAQGYKVKFGSSSGRNVVDAGMATSLPVAGLENGTAYSFAVSAYNSKGESADSNSLTAVPSSSPTPTPSPTHTPTPTPSPSPGAGITQGAAALTPSSLALWLSGATSWADVHYRVNGGTEQNVRMAWSNGRWEHAVTGLHPGDRITCWFTYWKNPGATDTGVFSYTFEGSPSSPTPTPTLTPTPTPTPTQEAGFTQGATTSSPSVLTIWLNGATSWADIHYQVNNGAGQNLRMLQANGRWEQNITGLSPGDRVSYWFTYWKNSGACDTGVFSCTIDGTPSSPTPTPSLTPTPTPTPTQEAGLTQGTSAISPSTLTIWSNGAVSWVDLHFRVNGGTEQNFRMLQANGRWEQNVTGLKQGDRVSYWFTYWKDTGACDTGIYSQVFTY